jgi:hypothetical protein
VWAVPPQSANTTDFQRFAKVQQDVYGNATFGMGLLDASERQSSLEHDVYDSEWSHQPEKARDHL